MYIVNKHGVIHTIPDDWKLPAEARPATDYEAEYYETGGSVAAKAPKPAPKAKKEDAKQPAA